MKRKNLFSTLWVMAMISIITMASFPSSAFATGTTAGTEITNKATVSYNNGASKVSNDLVLFVAHKVVANIAGTTVITSGEGRVINTSLTVTNGGNRVDSYSINSGVTPVIYDAANPTVPAAGWSVVMKDGSTTITGGTIGDIPIDQSKTINFEITVPTGTQAEDNHNYIVKFVLKTNKTTSGSAGTHDLIVVANPNDVFEKSLTIQIRRPKIAVSIDPVSNLSATTQIPGSTVTYRIKVENTGSTGLTSNATLSFKLNGTYTESPSVGSSTPAGSAGATTTWTINSGDLGSNESVTRDVTVTIKKESYSGTNGTGVPNGTPVSVPATDIALAYTFDGASFTKNPAIAADFAVDQASGVTMATYAPIDQSNIISSTTTYYFKIKNEGNATDNFDLSRTISATSGTIGGTDVFTYAISTDFNANPLSSAGWTPITTSDANTTPFNTDFAVTSIPQGAERWIRIIVSLPATATYGASRTISFAAVPHTVVNQATSVPATPSVTGYKITVTAPELTITLSTEAVGTIIGTKDNPAPGDKLYYIYTIANGATYPATDVESHNMTDHESTNSIVAGTIEIDDGTGSFVTSTGWAGGTVTSTASVVTVKFNTIPVSTTKRYRYQVQF